MKAEAKLLAPELEKHIFAESAGNEVEGGETRAQADTGRSEAQGDVAMNGE